MPSNLVFKEGSLDLHDWCHGAINRSAAEFLLVRSDLPGSFLVRESQSKPGDYTLSLYDGKVAHYRINEQAGKFFIRQKQTFPSIPDLISHHQEHHSGLPLKLTHIVPKAHAKGIVISKKDEETWEMNRNEIKLGKMLGQGNYGEVYKAKWRGGEIAVKTVKEDSMGIDEFMREAQVMKMMKHPNLVLLLGVCSTDIPMYVHKKYSIVDTMAFKLLYAGFKTCFGWDPWHQRHWDPIAKTHLESRCCLRHLIDTLRLTIHCFIAMLLCCYTLQVHRDGVHPPRGPAVVPQATQGQQRGGQHGAAVHHLAGRGRHGVPRNKELHPQRPCVP